MISFDEKYTNFLAKKIGKGGYSFVKPLLPSDKNKQLKIFGILITLYNIVTLLTIILLVIGIIHLNYFIGIFTFEILFEFIITGINSYLINPKITDSESLLTENLENYEDLRSKYTLHNVKNATTSLDRIIGSLEVDKLSQENINDLKNYLERIYLTLDDFENNESSRLRNQQSFAVKELVSLFDKLVKSSLKAQRIKFNLVNQIDENKIIYQNLWDVFQVLHNLILNVQKALESPKIKEIVLICEETNSLNIHFFIKDTG